MRWVRPLAFDRDAAPDEAMASRRNVRAASDRHGKPRLRNGVRAGAESRPQKAPHQDRGPHHRVIIMALFKKSSGGGLFKKAETKLAKRHGAPAQPAANFPTSEDLAQG